MVGPYCKFCGHRCFVYRVLPDRSWSGHLATCPAGAEYDRGQLGCDHASAINPVVALRLLGQLAGATGLTSDQTRPILYDLLCLLAEYPIPAELLEPYARFIHEENHDRNPRRPPGVQPGRPV
jgi:hypothetical protein